MSGTLKLGATGGQILFSTSGTSGLATPATGYGSLYYGTDSQLRLKDDAGTITILGAGGSGAGLSYGGGSVTSNIAGSVDGSALASNTTGANNSAIGDDALTANTIGSNNTAIGNGALDSNTTGDYNIAIGSGVLTANTTGSYNQAIGDQALSSNTTGDNNTAFGHLALSSNTFGTNNLAIGQVALQNNLTGANNIAIGYQSLEILTSGSGNLAIGINAMGFATGGVSNIAIGGDALRGSFSNFYGQSNVAIGNSAGFNILGAASDNTLIGSDAGVDITSGQNNVAIGTDAGYVITTGSNNIILGATGGTAGMASTFAYYNDANNNLTINSGAVVSAAAGASDAYIPIVIGGTTYKLLLHT